MGNSEYYQEIPQSHPANLSQWFKRRVILKIQLCMMDNTNNLTLCPAII